MSNNTIYQIISSSNGWSDYPIMSTLSIRQVELTLKKIREAVEKNSELRLDSNMSDERNLHIYDNEGAWYGSYRVESRRISKYGEVDTEILSEVKNILEYKIEGEE